MHGINITHDVVCVYQSHVTAPFCGGFDYLQHTTHHLGSCDSESQMHILINPVMVVYIMQHMLKQLMQDSCYLALATAREESLLFCWQHVLN